MTDKLREAAQMALDALEKLNKDGWILADFEDEVCASIEALRAALAQQEPVATLFGSLPVYDVPTKQEPVAWMHTFIDEVVIAHRPADLDRHPDRWTALYKDPPPCQTCEALARTVMMDQTSHDTPPQREWQGLTDEERKEIIRQQKDFWGPVGWELECTKAIEAKLKEKNS